MGYDYRHNTADYYDRFSGPPWDDVAFYRQHLRNHDARVLELGCGTGRVLIPLAQHAALVYGVDLSPDMLRVCDQNIKQSDAHRSRLKIACADISDFDLTSEEPSFDLITAPFRVMQNLETDAQVDGLMRCIKKHLAPGGEAILNTFQPRGGYKELKTFWSSRNGSVPCWSKSDGNHTVIMSDDCTAFRSDPVAVYPKLIYRRYNESNTLIDESILEIVMRVWQPDELTSLINRHGFKITECLGGYEGEPWGEGPELVVAFTH